MIIVLKTNITNCAQKSILIKLQQIIVSDSFIDMKQSENNEVFFIEDNSVTKEISEQDSGGFVPEHKKLGSLKIQFDSECLSESFLNVETQYYQIYVTTQSNYKNKQPFEGKSWALERRYSDFEWLFHSLSMTFPGSILPYFPTKTIESFFLQKLNLQWAISMSKKDEFEKRKLQLENFLRGVSNNERFRNSREFIIFMEQEEELFRKLKKDYQTQLQESNSYESNNSSILSVFEKSLAWVTERKQVSNVLIEEAPEWNHTYLSIKKQSALMNSVLSKIERLMTLKVEEIDWEGPETEIDSVEVLKTRVHSSRQFNQLLIIDLRNEVLPLLEDEVKLVKQIQSQLEQRENLIKILMYLRKTGGDEHRINKLLRKKHLFEDNLITEWAVEVERMKGSLKGCNKAMIEAWRAYSQKMSKIWK